MNDLISREDAINAMMVLKREDDLAYGCEIPESFDSERAIEALKNIPSAEPKRTAKVIIYKRYIGTNLNIVGTPNILCEHLCGACKKKVIDGDDYCSHCGTKLEWNE